MDQPASADLADARAAFVDAIRVGDIDALADLYDDGARLIVPDAGEAVRGRTDVAAFWRAGMRSGIVGIRLEPEDVELRTSMAWEVGRYELELLGEDGAPLFDRGRYLLVYGLAGDRWRRTAEMFRPDPAGMSVGA
jgi:ketosteroid isomerase-like protein